MCFLVRCCQSIFGCFFPSQDSNSQELSEVTQSKNKPYGLDRQNEDDTEDESGIEPGSDAEFLDRKRRTALR